MKERLILGSLFKDGSTSCDNLDGNNNKSPEETPIKYFSEYSNILINKVNNDYNYKFLVNITEKTQDDIFIKSNDKNIKTLNKNSTTSVEDFNEDDKLEL